MVPSPTLCSAGEAVHHVLGVVGMVGVHRPWDTAGIMSSAVVSVVCPLDMEKARKWRTGSFTSVFVVSHILKIVPVLAGMVDVPVGLLRSTSRYMVPSCVPRHHRQSWDKRPFAAAVESRFR